MKSIFLLILLGLFLSGCGKEAGEETTEMMTEARMPEMISETTERCRETDLFTPLIHPKDSDFVRVKDYIPSVFIDLKYASSDNFTNQVIYNFHDVFLRYGTVMKLKEVAAELELQGLFLKIWDGFRPVSVQYKLWEICPDPTYVANPNKGYSNHSRGFAVDVTLVDQDGMELEMPTGFDDFSEKADRDYSDCTETAAKNAAFLQTLMEHHGFDGYWGEWWHFNDTVRYDVENCFDPAVICSNLICTETVLWEDAGNENSMILTIPAGERITLLGYMEEYAQVEFWGYRGFVYADALMRME